MLIRPRPLPSGSSAPLFGHAPSPSELSPSLWPRPFPLIPPPIGSALSRPSFPRLPLAPLRPAPHVTAGPSRRWRPCRGQRARSEPRPAPPQARAQPRGLCGSSSPPAERPRGRRWGRCWARCGEPRGGLRRSRCSPGPARPFPGASSARGPHRRLLQGLQRAHPRHQARGSAEGAAARASRPDLLADHRDPPQLLFPQGCGRSGERSGQTWARGGGGGLLGAALRGGRGQAEGP